MSALGSWWRRALKRVAAVPRAHAAGVAVALALVATLVVGSRVEPAPTSPEPSPTPTLAVPAVSAAPDADVPFSAREAPTVWVLDDPAEVTVVVNKSRPLEPLDFVPADLETLDPIPGGGAQRMVPVAADALRAMHAAAAEDGVAFGVGTAYRSYGFQAGIYWSYARDRGTWWADQGSARPGYSEHQTGLAVDVVQGDDCRLERCFADTAAGRWVAEHAWRYGFIVRYPEGKQAWTGYRWEPWHLRYVGEDVAAAMREEGKLTLEGFFGTGKAPTYR